MCGVGEDNFDDIVNVKCMPKNEKALLSGKCNKCREETPCIVLRSKDKYCRQCFLAGTVHKFKALLGKHKLIHPDDRVMIVYKCGHPTTALLHFIKSGLDLETHKKLRFQPHVLFIEEQLHLPLKTRQDIMIRAEKEVTSYNFPIYFTSITQLTMNTFSPDMIKTKSKYFEQNEDDKTIIDKYLTRQINDTNKKDFLNIKRRQLCIYAAKYLKCKFIFLPEISNDTASQILIDISLGRGSHIPLDTGFCDSREEDVKILRPLRLFDAKELAFYNYLNNLEPVTFKISEEQFPKSIQTLMQNFITSLQVNYPATVTTVLKTGDKLATNKLTKSCKFCKAPIGEEKGELTSAESTQFSHWLSTHRFDCGVTSQDRYNNILESFENMNCDIYCFSCQKLNV